MPTSIEATNFLNNSGAVSERKIIKESRTLPNDVGSSANNEYPHPYKGEPILQLNTVIKAQGTEERDPLPLR